MRCSRFSGLEYICRQRPLWHFPTSLICIFFLSAFLAAPVWSQCDNTGAAIPANPNSGSFASNFLGPAATNYEFPIPSTNGILAAGDLNATYFQYYYSIMNAANAINPASGRPYCPLELVMVGSFPNGRYFSLIDYDMHYSPAQHLADFTIVPLSSSYVNPYLPGIPYQAGQGYLAPISLGYVPQTEPPTGPPGGTGLPACSIAVSENENLLDATQRHLFMDWNTIEEVAPFVRGVVGTSVPNNAHVVDTPQHTAGPNNSGPNTAGSVIIRSYLSPPSTCTGSGGNAGTITCTQPPAPPAQYVILRDAYTGCPYPVNKLPPGLVYNPPQGATLPNCYSNPTATGCSAVVSMVDLSKCPSGSSNCSVPNWLDNFQKKQHTTNINITPEACYANGDPAQGAKFGNRVAWTRSQEWAGSPGPDDSYIGAAVSQVDLAKMGTNKTLMRFRFKLPMQATPATPPCTYPFEGPACSFTGNEALRYMSLTFWNQPTSCQANAADTAGANPDGLVSSSAGTCKPISLLSLADVSFAPSPSGYVTLLVNADPTVGLPTFLQQGTSIVPCVAPAAGKGPAAKLCGVAQGAMPQTSSLKSGQTYYSVWWPNNCNGIYTACDPYTVVDLSRTKGFSDKNGIPLLLTVRNTLTNGTFTCSGSAVPYSTAEYTNVDGNGGGLMGPYIPLVDFPTVASLLQKPAPLSAASLPSESACGNFVGSRGAIFPMYNTPSITASAGGNGPYYGSLNWPVQYWPTETANGSKVQELLLNCGAGTRDSTEIYFAATQRTTQTIKQPSNQCGMAYFLPQTNPCTQVVAQSAQETFEYSQGLWQPPLPLQIVGQGFGFLPAPLSLPMVLPSCNGGSSCNQNYIQIRDSQADGSNWDTTLNAQCQIYISNWTDSSISIAVNLPINAINASDPDPLSPIADMSPLTFTPETAPPALNMFGCPIVPNDLLTVTVKNPQTGTTAQLQNVPVLSYITRPN